MPPSCAPRHDRQSWRFVAHAALSAEPPVLWPVAEQAHGAIERARRHGRIVAVYEPSAPRADLLPSPRDTSLDLGPLLPTGSALWAYYGSLTTPPCREIVTFYLAQRPLPVSRSEIDSFTARVGLRSTARPVQRRDQSVVREIPATGTPVGG
jgi:hypothetical protein